MRRRSKASPKEHQSPIRIAQPSVWLCASSLCMIGRVQTSRPFNLIICAVAQESRMMSLWLQTKGIFHHSDLPADQIFPSKSPLTSFPPPPPPPTRSIVHRDGYTRRVEMKSRPRKFSTLRSSHGAPCPRSDLCLMLNDPIVELKMRPCPPMMPRAFCWRAEPRIMVIGSAHSDDHESELITPIECFGGFAPIVSCNSRKIVRQDNTLDMWSCRQFAQGAALKHRCKSRGWLVHRNFAHTTSSK